MGAWGKATACFSHGLFQYYSTPWKVQVPVSLVVCLKYPLAAAAGAFPRSGNERVLIHLGVAAPAALGTGVHVVLECDPLSFDLWWQKNGFIRVKISSAACGLGVGVTAFIKMLWLKTSCKMHVHIYSMLMHVPTYKSAFMPADTLVVEMQAVEMQICENGKVLRGSSFCATCL